MQSGSYFKPFVLCCHVMWCWSPKSWWAFSFRISHQKWVKYRPVDVTAISSDLVKLALFLSDTFFSCEWIHKANGNIQSTVFAAVYCLASCEQFTVILKLCAGMSPSLEQPVCMRTACYFVSVLMWLKWRVGVPCLHCGEWLKACLWSLTCVSGCLSPSPLNGLW